MVKRFFAVVRPDTSIAPKAKGAAPCDILYMKINRFILTVAITAALGSAAQHAFAKEKTASSGGTDATFVNKAAIGGMTEVELGRIAAEKGQSQEVKDFGNRMVTDHSKANDQLKSVASAMGATAPEKVDAKHQAIIDKFSKMPAGAAFDKAYAKNMVQDHEEDIAEFQKAAKEVKNADLKKFAEDTIPVMKEHLEMMKKIQASLK